MDVAYDHIQESALSPTTSNSEPQTARPSSDSTTPTPQPNPPASPTLSSDLSSAFKAAASSQWGTTLNSWFSSARQQGQTFYQDLQKEASEASEQATKGFTTLREEVVKRTRSLSLSGPGDGVVPVEEPIPPSGVQRSVDGGDASTGASAEAEALQQPLPTGSERPESLPADIVKEAGTLVASLRSTAASKLKDLQRAEDAADEALLKFGTNIRNFLRDAVVITAPDDEDVKAGETGSELLFETQEPGTGKKVFHSTRLDAQLHAIHTTSTSFTQDPAEGAEWEAWRAEFDVEQQTEAVAKDLERYEELRRAMEKLVPEKVEYRVFWMRYHVLRKAVEEDERKRREVLKGTSTHACHVTTC